MENKIIEVTPVEAIRLLSGIITPKDAVDRLALVNLLSRYILGLAEKNFVEETMLNMGVKLVEESKQEYN